MLIESSRNRRHAITDIAKLPMSGELFTNKCGLSCWDYGGLSRDEMSPLAYTRSNVHDREKAKALSNLIPHGSKYATLGFGRAGGPQRVVKLPVNRVTCD